MAAYMEVLQMVDVVVDAVINNMTDSRQQPESAPPSGETASFVCAQC